jgi:integrase/recombinase XerC
MELTYKYDSDVEQTSTLSKRKSTKAKNNNQKVKATLDFIDDFETFLLQLNYSETTVSVHKRRAKKICNIIQEISGILLSSLSDCENISCEMITKYEQYLNDQIKRNNLKPYSAYCDLKTVRLFLKFLYFNKVIAYKYKIPKEMISPVNRSNLYIDTTTIIQLAENIASRKKLVIKYRNLALFLLIVETGCRPVEVSSILITDVKFTEKTIRLNSVKSGTRTVKLNNYVLGVLKEYFYLRNKLNSKCEYFFLKNNGSKTNSTYISSLLNLENKNAFGNVNINARGLRHTYITNAIDNNNDIVNISATIGHKHWASTMHYLHRDKKRLLKNTLPHSPIHESLIKGDDQNAHKRSK